MQSFSLRRYYAVVSLVGITTVIFALSWFSRNEAIQTLLKHQALANEDITNSFANSLWPEFNVLLKPSDSALKSDNKTLEEQLSQLLTSTQAQMLHTSVVKVKMYNLDGLTVFSTDTKQIGEDHKNKPQIASALDGNASSKFVFRNQFDAFDRTIQDRNLITSYIPIRDIESGAVIAIFELCSDVTGLIKNIDATQSKIITVITLSLSMLYLFLYVMVNRAHRLIRTQEKFRQANEDKIRQQAYTDTLTGLPNRDQFVEDINTATNQAMLMGTQGAVLFLDLDRFKTINDSLGHDAGDRLLRIISSRIQACTRQNDTAFRISGDEFIVLMEDLDNADEAANLAKRILEKINEPIILGDQEITVSVSIGITSYHDNNKCVDDLVKEADAAMYRAKRTASNHFEFYSSEMDMITCEKLKMETELQRALKNNQFVLHYQPKVDAVTREILSVEALLRWDHPEKGLIPANTFIPILEETGLINAVGSWVLLDACQQAQTWIKAGFAPVRMSVNMSAKQFRDNSLVDTVRRVLEQTGLDAKYLELELTESMFIEDTEFAIQVMMDLKALGVLLSIDDFGSGYSSLSYLKHFPVDFLKIDRSFIKDLASNDKDESILVAISALARSMKLGLIAEGVEDEAQFNRLQDKGCDELQGFLFSPPIPSEEFENKYFPAPHLRTGYCQ